MPWTPQVRVPAMLAKTPELKNVEPFKTVLSRSREAMDKLSMRDLEKILAATLTGMSVEDFDAEAKQWLEAARDPRWKRPQNRACHPSLWMNLVTLHAAEPTPSPGP